MDMNELPGHYHCKGVERGKDSENGRDLGYWATGWVGGKEDLVESISADAPPVAH